MRNEIKGIVNKGMYLWFKMWNFKKGDVIYYDKKEKKYKLKRFKKNKK